MRHASLLLDLLIAGALTLAAAIARAPYLAEIPIFEDEVMQTVYALSIQPGKFMPLVGNDPYVGPLFSYFMAACLRVVGASPIAPRFVALTLGALTVGLTYLLGRALGLGWRWAALSGLLMVANPHHIYNSHYPGSTYMVPLFCTAFLAALALAVKRESGLWLVAAGALFGLALQSNPVSALILPGVAIWFLTLHKQRIGLSGPWPYLAVCAFALAYAPVIIYNTQNGLLGAVVAEHKQTYVWQPNPSLATYLQNSGHLTLQLGRQLGGVLESSGSFSDWVGLPLVLGMWSAAGLVYTTRKEFRLLTLAVGSQMLIMPWASNYYGNAYVARFTIQLTPPICVSMSVLAAALWNAARTRLHSPVVIRTTAWATGALLIALCLWPLVPLFRFYNRSTARGETNTHQMAFFDELLRGWRGEKILLSESVNGFMSLTDSITEYNATEYFLAASRVPYTLMPIGHILERLAAGKETGRITLILHNDDLPQTQSQADLIVWNSPAMQMAHRLGYGIYTIAEARQVRKPAFVITDVASLPPTVRPVQANLADQLGVIGYALDSDKLTPGQRFSVRVYWKPLGVIPESYMGFMHLIGPDGHLVTQDDHELGRGLYRTLVWQPNEVIREKYDWPTPPNLPNGEYTLRLGAYHFPSLQRLPVRFASVPAKDDVLTLGAVHVGP